MKTPEDMKTTKNSLIYKILQKLSSKSDDEKNRIIERLLSLNDEDFKKLANFFIRNEDLVWKRLAMLQDKKFSRINKGIKSNLSKIGIRPVYDGVYEDSLTKQLERIFGE
jgi:uncharacterized membrane protein YgaE (UPF0421/DUF939 family)